MRSRLAEAASVAVGALPVDDVPIPLRRLARFTPAKRSRLGRPALLAELEASGAFRAAVVAWWDEHRPGELTPTVDDPLAAAAAAVLAGRSRRQRTPWRSRPAAARPSSCAPSGTRLWPGSTS